MKKNIAIIVPTLNKGGAERVAANLSLKFAEEYNVYLFVHDGSNITYPYAGELVDLKLPPAKSKLGKVVTMLKRVLMVRKLKKQYNIHYSISHLPPSNYVNILTRVNDKIFSYDHCMEYVNKKAKLLKKLVAMLSDKLICVSECVRDNDIANFGVSAEKAVTVYNFCDLDVDIHKERENDCCVIANMGRLLEQKGQWHLVRSMKKVIEEENVRLIIYGDGEYRARLEELIDKLNLNEYVTLAGYIENPFAQLAQADIYVSSSLWEGLPMALIEASNCGLPIITTDCDAGCREIVSPMSPIHNKTKSIEFGEYGILVPVCEDGTYLQSEITPQEQIMAEAIIMLVRDSKMRRKYAALAKARAADFRSEAIMKIWRNLLR